MVLAAPGGGRQTRSAARLAASLVLRTDPPGQQVSARGDLIITGSDSAGAERPRMVVRVWPLAANCRRTVTCRARVYRPSFRG